MTVVGAGGVRREWLSLMCLFLCATLAKVAPQMAQV